MEEKPNIEMVYMAISSLYGNPDASEKERASRWLGEFQKSVHAWTIADEILRQNRDLESCYFAAQTMRSKVQNSFHELPAEAHSSLRDSLLNHMSQINESTNSIIVTQLCLALADLILQMVSWQRAVIDLISRLSSGSLWPLLEVLIVLPEEWESRSVRLGETRRKEVLEDLKVCAGTVNEFLKHCTNTYYSLQQNVQMNVKVLKCLASWTSLGAITLDDLTDNIVMHNAMSVLNYKQDNEKNSIAGALHDAATECVCTLLKCLEDNNNQQALESYLFNNIILFELPYHISVANEDQEKSMNYCRIFTELGETFLDKIINQSNETYQQYAMKILDLVLICVGHHDYEVAEITFNLWYLLSEELYQRKDKVLIELFRPYVERLIQALCRHCQMEPDYEGLLEDGEDFKDFRLKVSDLVKDIVFIVGSASCFKHMFMTIQSPGVTWEQTEAALFIMQAVAKHILPVENEVVPKVGEAILSIPHNTHVAVRYTSVLLLGELCEWIEQHPNSLDPILNFLVSCLPQSGVGAAAATALQNICTTCNEHMSRHMPVMLQLMHQVDTFAITNTAVIGLLKGVAAILSKMQHEDLVVPLRELCFMQINPLCRLVEEDTVPARGTKTDPVLWLDRLASIFRHLVVYPYENEVNPCKIVILEVWPVLSRVCSKYQSDARIMERGCRTIRFMLRCVSQQVKEILETFVPQIVSIYSVHHHSCFLYLGSILVDEYGTDPHCIQGLLTMLQTFIGPTFALLQEENGLKNHPDTVDDFFRLCTRLMQRAPVPFLQCGAIPHIIQCGLLAATLDHKEANTSVMKFFCDLVRAAHTSHKNDPQKEELRALAHDVLQKFGDQLVAKLVYSSVFCLHTYMLAEVGDVFVELLQYDRQVMSKWLYDALAALPNQTGNCVITVTPQQLQGIHQSVIASDTLKSVTYALKDLVYLFR